MVDLPKNSDFDDIDPSAFDTGGGTMAGAANKDPEAKPSALPLAAGSKIGRYIILEKLGEGGMGMVFSAFDPQLDRKVAIKLVHHAKTGEKDSLFAQQLLNEAKAVAKLSHPNVVTVYDAGTWEEQVFISMEYVEGVSIGKWMKDEKRSWLETLRVFIEAGQGLAAAHAVGIVHRDFKPENIIMGKDQRVRVIDFGIALEMPKPGEPANSSQSGPEQSKAELPKKPMPRDPTWDDLTTKIIEEARTKGSSVRMTLGGMVAGTPAYMALEQQTGQASDARSDQFSFCASLYRALYGVLPFKGRNFQEIEAAKAKSTITPPPPGSVVPSWLHKVILKGLAIKPEDRWPTIEALLAKLRYDPAKKRRRIMLSAGVIVAVGATVSSLLYAQGSRAVLCKEGAERLAGVWDVSKKQEIQKSFLSTQVEYAQDSWKQTEAQLDRYTVGWVEGYQDACQATRIKGEQSEQLLDIRMLCLSRRLNELRALTDLFAKADSKLVERAVEAVGKLEEAKRCADGERLMNEWTSMEKPKNSEQVEETRKKLAQVAALELAGQFPEGLTLSQKLLQEAQRDEYPPVEAEALYWVGFLFRRNEKYEQAEEYLKRSVWVSLQARYEPMTVKAATTLVKLTGSELIQKEEWTIWQGYANAILKRSQDDPLQEAELLESTALALEAKGQYSQSVEQHRQALAIREKILGPDHFLVSKSMLHIASVFTLDGDYREAVPLLDKVYSNYNKLLGSSHPAVATVLGYMAMAYVETDPKQALVLYNQVLSLLEKLYGTKGLDYLTMKMNRAILFSKMGQFVSANKEFMDLIVNMKEVRGADDPELGNVMTEFGAALLRQGDLKKARQLYEQGLALMEKGFGKDHPWVAETLVGLARVYDSSKLNQLAQETLIRSVKLYEQNKSKNLGYGDALTLLAELYLRNKMASQAVPLLERALTIYENVKMMGDNKARAQFDLGRALIESGKDREKALDHLGRARLVYQNMVPIKENAVIEIDNFLRKHGVIPK